MKVPRHRTRELVCVLITLTLMALAVASIRALVSFASGSAKPAVATHPALSYDAPSNMGGRRMTLGLDDGELVLADKGGAVLSSRPLTETSEVVVKGSNGDDTLVVDFTHGNPIPAGGLKFDGGAQVTRSGDAIVIEGGHFETVIYDYYNANDGRIVLDGSVINYAGLEPITVTGDAANAIINLPADAQNNQAILEDDGVAGNGKSRLRSGNSTFETTDFNNPTTSLTINASNDGEKITVNNVDSGFVAKINLNGGTANDSFALGDGATLKGGQIVGGAGTNTLDYSAYTSAVSVNLGFSFNSSFIADMNGVQETPPNTSPAVGNGFASIAYNFVERRFENINFVVNGIDKSQVTGLKIRRGPVNSAGPEVIDLLSKGSVTPSGAGSFQYNTATVIPLPPDQEAAFFGGLFYLEVQTIAFPAGEIRGQIITQFTQGFVGPTWATGTAATFGISGISTVIGGSGNDSLVGPPFVGSSLQGGPGDDTFYGAAASALQGDGGNDTFCLDRAVGPTGGTIIDGGAGTDLVNFNDLNSASAFFVQPAGIGGRLILGGTALTNFDVGTVETVTASGFGGNDQFTAGSLAGVADLTTINFNGMLGNDTFNITPSAAVTFNINGGEPFAPTVPGDLLTLDTTGVTNLLLTANNTTLGSQGSYTFGNRQPVNFQTLDSVSPTVLRVNDVTVPEGNAGSTGAVFTVSLEAPTNTTVTVDYVTFNGTATAPGDYTSVNGTLSFSPGQTTRFVTVPINGDTLREGNETVILNLSNPVSALLPNSQGVATITDDDPLPSLSIANTSVTEGNSGTTAATFTVSLSAASGQTISVNYATANGTATAPTDYAAAGGTLNFAAGETSKTVTVLVAGDTLAETNENFFVNLSGPVNATIASAQGTGTINDDDTVPDLSVANASITEGSAGTTNLVFTATLSAASSQTVVVDYFTSDGTALTPGDYQFAGGTLVFNPGQTSRTIAVPIVGDTMPESTESFFVNLTNPTNVNVVTIQARATIFDDDASGIIQFSATTSSAAEASGSATVTVTRTGDTSGVASVNFETADLTAAQRSDYTFGSGVVQFAPGETSKTVKVLLVNDALIEGAETFAVTLSNPSGNFVVGSPGQIVITITDDDVSPATNPIDDATLFVRQQYLDFLGREPDIAGLNFWVGEITSCGADAGCREAKRVNVSAAFFLSIEFQETGGFVTRMQRVAFEGLSADPASRVPYLQFMRDTRQVGAGVVVGASGYETKLEANKQAYAQQIVTSAGFLARFPITPAADYVDALFASAAVTPTGAERTAAISAFGAGGTAGRVAALRSVTDSASVRQAEFNSFFVLAEYFGYLRRNPTDAPDFDDAGYQFWLSKLNFFNGDFVKAEMVKAFITSPEYRGRFGQP